jgi:two-component system, chemotaxis family, CheB/CheR fusion protein
MAAAGSPTSTAGGGSAPAEPGTDGGPRPAEPGEAGRPGGRTTPASARPIRVLVLDDEPSIRDFLGRVLKRSGYVPIVAATGAAALEAIHVDPPDAILCDHRMAGMSGTEFHAAVVEISPRLARRFAFMSGDVLNPELRDFAEARGVHLLAKPFDIATVASIVAELLAIEPD